MTDQNPDDICFDEGEEPPYQEPAIQDTPTGRILWTTFKGCPRTIGGVIRDTLTLVEAVQQADRPGDVIQCLAGKYWPPFKPDQDPATEDPTQPIVIRGMKGAPDRPIVIRGLGFRTQLCGANTAPHYDVLPNPDQFAFFQMFDCEWVVIEDFDVMGSWPSFLLMEECRYMTVRKLKATDSRYFIFARGEQCHHVLIENIDWTQDPTGALWSDYNWAASHHGAYGFMNGGLFGSSVMAGSVVIRHNKIRECYNGIRMKAEEGTGVDRHNLNVEIYNNLFEHNRDNPIEPERGATNWWIHHNHIANGHGWFSFDSVGGGYWYLFANIGASWERPGQPWDVHDMGKVFKFDYDPPYPHAPVWTFNNSWFLRGKVINKGKTEHFNHYNNACVFCHSQSFPEGVCPENVNMMNDDFLTDAWVPSVRFDYDLDNKPFPEHMTKNGQETHGVVAPDFRYVDPFKGDFRPAAGQMPQGCDIVLEAGTDWPGTVTWKASTELARLPDIGAWQTTFNRVLNGPPFAFYTSAKAPAGYVERPRIVRVERHGGKRLVIHFSVPVNVDGSDVLALKAGPGDERTVRFTVDGACLTAELAAFWSPLGSATIVLPRSLYSVADGLPVTLWATVDNRVMVAAA